MKILFWLLALLPLTVSAVDLKLENSHRATHTLETEVLTRAVVELMNENTVLRERTVKDLAIGDHIVTFSLNSSPMTVTGVRLSVDYTVPQKRRLTTYEAFTTAISVPANEQVRVGIRIESGPPPVIKSIAVMDKGMISTAKPPTAFALTGEVVTTQCKWTLGAKEPAVSNRSKVLCNGAHSAGRYAIAITMVETIVYHEAIANSWQKWDGKAWINSSAPTAAGFKWVTGTGWVQV